MTDSLMCFSSKGKRLLWQVQLPTAVMCIQLCSGAWQEMEIWAASFLAVGKCLKACNLFFRGKKVFPSFADMLASST
jgi:hypothetical protein